MTVARRNRPAKAAAYVELELENGVDRFHCPACGAAIIVPENGFSQELCEHVVLTHDWIGEFYARDEVVDGLIEKAEAEAEENNGYAIELLRKAFSQNVAFFEFFEPQKGSKPAEVATVAVDLGHVGPHLEE